MQTKIYPNGLKLVVEEMSGFESVAFNMFFKTGSINEKPSEYGISHFIEHMMFKGTKKRDSFEISKAFDDLGASVNAYTSFESTCYYTKCASEHIENCVEIFSDMLFNSVFDKTEMEREKNVVIEEIKMYADDPQSMVEMLANKNFYCNLPYARDISGTITNVKSITQGKMFAYKNKFYVPQNLTLSFAGKINLKTAEKLVEKYFLNNFEFVGEKVEHQFENRANINYGKQFKDNEQSQVVVSFPGLSNKSTDKFVAKVFNKAFGSGMSSILFQSIREKLGLVYSIYSSVSANYAGGDLSISFATSNKNVKNALIALQKEIENLKENGLSDEQFNSAKNGLITAIKLQYESTSNVSHINAKGFAYDELISKLEYINSVKKVTNQQVHQFIKTHFAKHYTVAVVGRNKSLNLKNFFTL